MITRIMRKLKNLKKKITRRYRKGNDDTDLFDRTLPEESRKDDDSV